MKTHMPESAKPQNQSSSRQPFIRPKLNVNTPGDAHEQEADATADNVMRMKTPGSPASPGSPGKPANGRYYDPWRPEVRDPFVTPRGYNRNGEYYDPYRPQDTEPFGPRPKPRAVKRNPYLPDEYLEDGKLSTKEIPLIQRKCSDCEQEEKTLQRKEGHEDEDKTLLRKESTGAETQADGSLNSYVNSLGASGQPLPDASREFFEPRFGRDFSGVKIHNDSVAAKSAQSINALAYTTGNNIVFNEGQFAPGSDSGDRLLAHELTHVVQQGGGNGKVMKKEDGKDNNSKIEKQGQFVNFSIVDGKSKYDFKLYFDESEAETNSGDNEHKYKTLLFCNAYDGERILLIGPLNVKLKTATPSLALKNSSSGFEEFLLDDKADYIRVDHSITPEPGNAIKQPDEHGSRIIKLQFSGNLFGAKIPVAIRTYNGKFTPVTPTTDYGDFRRFVLTESDKALSQNKVPATIQGEIAQYDDYLIKTYTKAANDGLIKKETLEAWMNLKLKIMVLENHSFGLTEVSQEDKRLIDEAAKAAKTYYSLIKSDTAGSERKMSRSVVPHAGNDTETSTETATNPYTGEISSTTYTGIREPSHWSSEIHLDTDIESKDVARAKEDMKLLDIGFNEWVASQAKAKPKDKNDQNGQLQGALALRNSLSDLSANKNITNIQRVNSLYYSYDRFKDKKIEAAPLPVYIYYDQQEEAWYIADYIDPGKPFKKGIGASKDKAGALPPPPVQELFLKLNSADHLPKGYIVYSSADGTFKSGKVEMTEPFDAVRFLSVVAAVAGIIALTASIALSAGADAPVALSAIVAIAGGISATAGVTAAGLDIGKNIEDHTSTAGQVTMDIATIVASIAGAGALKAAGIIKAADEGLIVSGDLLRLANAFYVPLKITVLGADATNLLILSGDAKQQLDDIENSKMDDASKRTAITLLIGQLALAGTLFVVSIKGNVSEIGNQGKEPIVLRQNEAGEIEAYTENKLPKTPHGKAGGSAEKAGSLNEGTETAGGKQPTPDQPVTDDRGRKIGDAEAKAHGERPTHETSPDNLSEQAKEANFARKAQNNEDVVSSVHADDGHTLKLDQEGHVAECTTCEVYEISHQDVLANNPDLATELKAIRMRLASNPNDPATLGDLKVFDSKLKLQTEIDLNEPLVKQGRIKDFGEWMKFNKSKAGKEFADALAELREARRLASEDPDAVIRLAKETSAPLKSAPYKKGTGDERSQEFDIEVEEKSGEVRNIEVKAIRKLTSRSADMSKGVTHAAEKAASRVEEGISIKGKLEATIEIELLKGPVTDGSQTIKILKDGTVIKALANAGRFANGKEFETFNIFDEFIKNIQKIKNNRLLDKVNIIDRSGNLLTTYENSNGTWIRIKI